ncbi:MAG: tandem-95 repeat protein [Halobacteriovoraceae bacterium]|nr:tandem-95 repeat protein [Halobacteriovoraceae bacterium]
MKNITFFLCLLLFISCGGEESGGDLFKTSSIVPTDSVAVPDASDSAPIAVTISPASFNEDSEEIITLSYTDADSDLATACAISSPLNISETSACSCDGAGVCTVGVTGSSHYFGAASFDYTVSANSSTSAAVAANLNIDSVDDVPVSVAISPAPFIKNAESIITLSYSDVDSDLATVCSVSNLSNITESSACACDGSGVCTVGVTSTFNYTGAAGFDYTITANSVVSNVSAATLSIVDSSIAPVASAISPAAFNEDTQSIITLSYTDADSDLATNCSLTALTDITETSACSCDGAGACTVGVTGTLAYNGAASFAYTVIAGGQASNSVTASLTINAVEYAPVAANITPAAFDEDIQSIITLSYTDADSDKATACSVSNLSNITESGACSCNGSGVCTVGVTGSSNYYGAAGFDYTVTANGAASNTASATLTINSVADAPVAADITPANFNEDIESIISLSYTDAETDLATICTLSALTNITVSSACACDGAGACTVGVTGTANYNGVASFGYTVTAGAQASNTATASLTIDSVNDAPSLALYTGKSLTQAQTVTIVNTELDATDVDHTATDVTFTLEVAPTQGNLKNNGTIMSATDTFTQDDVDNSLITYEHTAGDTTADSFSISVEDALSAAAAEGTQAFALTIVVDSCSHGTTTITADGTFTVPADCYSITAKVWGAGGGGSPAPEDGGEGGQGGAGGYAVVALAVTPGDQFKTKIGLGGLAAGCGATGGAGAYAGGNGGATGANGSAGAGGGTGGTGGSGASGAGDGGDGAYGGGGGGGGESTTGGGGGGATRFTNFAESVEYAIAGGGGGGGADKESPHNLQGGEGCGGNGANGSAETTGGGGGGGACTGDTTTMGTNRTPANSGEAAGAAVGGTSVKGNACGLLDGSDGQIIVSY